MTLFESTALLVTDVQNGFITEERELPVPGGAEVVPIINRLLPLYPIRVASQDWHPRGHGSFASSHPGKRPFDVGLLAGMPQALWPDHCVQGTHGAALHPGLNDRLIQAIFRKGTDPSVDSYSMFADNAGRNSTGLDGYLRARGARAIHVAGLALDYCVRYTVRDARRLMPDLSVTVILDACRPVASRTGKEAVKELSGLGAQFANSSELIPPQG